MGNSIELGGIFSEGYGFVPKKLMKAKDISSNTKLVLCYLLSYTGAGCTAFPQQRDIAESLGISMRTVVNCIREAVDREYLKKVQEQRGQGIGKRNIYDLIFMREFASAKDAHAINARAKGKIASANSDTLQVHPMHTNNNNTNNNNTNNNSMAADTECIHADSELWHSGQFFNISKDQYESLKKAYPAIDIPAEVSKMENWLLSNPNRRKKNYARFVSNWLSRTAERMPKSAPAATYDQFRSYSEEIERKKAAAAGGAK